MQKPKAQSKFSNKTFEYDPQGMNLGTPPDVKQTVLNNPYQYKSKDRVEDLGIDLYEYGFRFSDQTIGRFITNNPLVNTPLNQHKTT